MKCLIPVLLSLPLLSGCDMVADLVDPALTPEQTSRLDVLEARNDELEAALAATRAEALVALKSADASAGEVVLAKLELQLTEQAAVSAEAQAIIDSSPTKLSGFMKFLGGIPSPLQPLIPVFGTILTVLAGKRSRKWAWISAKNVLSVGALDTFKNLGRMVGSVHSSESSEAAAVADPDSPLTA